MDIQLEIIGIVGGLLILFAFLQIASGRWDGKSFWYELCNFLGALFLVYYGVQKRAYTNIVLNLVWATVALYAALHVAHRQMIRKKKSIRSKK